MIPKLQVLPNRLFENALFDAQVWAGQKDRQLLLTIPVEQTQAPTARSIVLAQAPVELGPYRAALPGKLGGCLIASGASLW